MFAKTDVSMDNKFNFFNTEHVIWRWMATMRIPSTRSLRAGAPLWGKSSGPPTTCIMNPTIRTISGDDATDCKLWSESCNHVHCPQVELWEVPAGPPRPAGEALRRVPGPQRDRARHRHAAGQPGHGHQHQHWDWGPLGNTFVPSYRTSLYCHITLVMVMVICRVLVDDQVRRNIWF